MPSPRYSDTIAALLHTRISSGRNGSVARDSVWEDVDVLKTLGVSCYPTPKQVPDGWTPQQARDIFELHEAMKNNDYVENRLFMQSGTTCAAGRLAWQNVIFKNRIAPKLNHIVLEMMLEYGCHPQQVMTADESDAPPSSHVVGNKIQDDLIALFGPNVLQANGLITDHFSLAIGSLIAHNLANLRKARNRAEQLLPGATEKLELAMMPFGSDHVILTRQIFLEAFEALSAYHDAIWWFPGKLEIYEEKKAIVDECMRRLGYSPEDVERPALKPKAAAGEKRGRASAKSKTVEIKGATAEEVAQLISMYVEYFERIDTSEPTILDDTDLDMDLLLSTFPDLGVERRAQQDEESLNTLLSFENSRPVNWFPFRHTDAAKSSWNADDKHLYKEGGDGISELKLLWHQLVGISSIVDLFWTAEKTDTRPPGVLLSDAVGVGKTAQVMGVIAFLQHIYMSENQPNAESDGNVEPNVKLRPQIVVDKFFAGEGRVPNRAHLIVVPLSLLDQWKRELRTFFKPNAVDIFQLSGNYQSVKKFFAADGPFEKSKHNPIFRIVLVPLPTFQLCVTANWNTKRKRNYPDDIPNPKSDEPNIFSQSWSTAWLEEAHDFRGPTTRQFIGATYLRKIASFVNCLTATPLWTSPRDLINLGRLVGIPSYLGAGGSAYESESLRNINRAKRGITPGEKEEMRTIQAERLSGKDRSSADDPGLGLRRVEYQIVREIQEKFGPNIIRRTSQSLRYDKKPINEQLSMYDTVQMPITLPDEEMERLAADSFYLKYRTRIAYPRRSQDWPRILSKEHWEDNRGGKLQALIDLVLHLLSHDDASPPTVDGDGSISYPPIPTVSPGQLPPQTRKILINHEWTMMSHTIQSALAVHGIGCFVLNGSTHAKDRDPIIQDFIHNTDPNKRVLLFSSVGSSGLNLAVASIVIIYDQLWSGVATQQVIGRAWRLGQLLQVTVYMMLALGTTDITMASMATSKDMMLKAFVSKEKDKALEQILVRDDDVTEEDKAGDAKRRRIVRPKKITDEPMQEGGEGPSDQSGSSTKRGGNAKAKSKNDHEDMEVEDETQNAEEEEVEDEAQDADGSSTKKGKKARAKAKAKNDEGDMQVEDEAQDADGSSTKKGKKARAKAKAKNSGEDMQVDGGKENAKVTTKVKTKARKESNNEEEVEVLDLLEGGNGSDGGDGDDNASRAPPPLSVSTAIQPPKDSTMGSPVTPLRTVAQIPTAIQPPKDSTMPSPLLPTTVQPPKDSTTESQIQSPNPITPPRPTGTLPQFSNEDLAMEFSQSPVQSEFSPTQYPPHPFSEEDEHHFNNLITPTPTPQGTPVEASQVLPKSSFLRSRNSANPPPKNLAPPSAGPSNPFGQYTDGLLQSNKSVFASAGSTNAFTPYTDRDSIPQMFSQFAALKTGSSQANKPRTPPGSDDEDNSQAKKRQGSPLKPEQQPRNKAAREKMRVYSSGEDEDPKDPSFDALPQVKARPKQTRRR
ncbi:P-loop containing nucleoside triphosphate hydrolase protein [Pluteus cervinus]|uniref:P-loop containing nucleoside triphosphate hydrolase protein n=1 Tax=Pluteus cervinus TaxID=181527 RepID=A0ACD3A6Z2_9AGAR|nr:P-loop containing nucleoside triphosphate hydrolase protein [Pluteus cervinus]